MKLKLKIDFVLVIVVILIFILGLLNLYSASYNFGPAFVMKQMIWFIISLLIAIFVYLVGAKFFLNYSFLLYTLSLLLLIVLLLLPGQGPRCWLRFKFFSIQPSQLMKFSLPFFIVSFFIDKKFNTLSSFFLPLFFTVLPMVLIAKQPDLGGALLLAPALVTFFILKKASFRKASTYILLALVILPFLYLNLEPYQKKRVIIFLNPRLDPLGAGYTLLQSKIAIGSGKVFGRGWLRGIQGQLRFLPESHTDFVFPVFAEEWGFIGVIFLLFLYWIMFLRMKIIAENTKHESVKILLWLLLITFSVQIILNLGMSMGIFPVVGLPLPFFSYGGSDLVVTLSIVAIFLNSSRKR